MLFGRNIHCGLPYGTRVLVSTCKTGELILLASRTCQTCEIHMSLVYEATVGILAKECGANVAILRRGTLS